MVSLKWLLFFIFIFSTALQTKASAWKAKVPSSVKGLLGSCVVIPCTFDYPDPKRTLTEISGMWTNADHQLICHTVQSKVIQQFRGRTELLGDVRQKNCTLKIDPLKESDRGPLNFRIEMANYEKYSYRQSAVTIAINREPDPISLSVKDELVEGETVSASCSASHSCPFSPPLLNWSLSGKETLQHQQHDNGQWQTTSTLTFHPTNADHGKALQCNVTYKGEKHLTASKVLKVKYAPMDVKVEYKSDVKEGESVRLKCSSDANPPANSYDWSNETGAQLHHGKVYMLRSVSRHTGALYCTASNTVGQGKSSPVHLNVLHAPLNVKVEYESDVKEGESVRLKCSSDANPPASSFDWSNETGAQLHHGKVYMLHNVSRHTGALYCTANNTVGQGKSSPVHLSVLHAPEIKTVSSCSSEADMVKCVCIAESRPPSMVHFVLSDRVLPKAKVEKHGPVTIGTIQAKFGSSEFVHCLANNTQGSANLTLYFPVNSKMQSIYVFIAIGTAVILVILFMAVGIKKCRGRSEAASETQLSTMKAHKDVEHSQYAATQRQERAYDDVDLQGIYTNDHVYGNMETDPDDAIYANV
ncbi:myelin-associated glycoprotein-like isoform X1 [Cheilinus undulatus]|uniref:myelin-associated glycoprotein-like isoform X1 n=1 Tax=Cheilinus undulatus TaxID=241271 RepID=UPI001BD6B94F|nr:myelin-associated glycoprotein-like isoform X1 [Cheilinus undulatus]